MLQGHFSRDSMSRLETLCDKPKTCQRDILRITSHDYKIRPDPDIILFFRNVSIKIFHNRELTRTVPTGHGGAERSLKTYYEK